MSRFNDNNFGNWEMEDEEDLQFYQEVQARSVEKECQGCGDLVMLLPQYVICDACASEAEGMMRTMGY